MNLATANQYVSILDNLNEAICVVAISTGKIEYANKMFTAYYNTQEGELWSNTRFACFQLFMDKLNWDEKNRLEHSCELRNGWHKFNCRRITWQDSSNSRFKHPNL